MLIPTCLAAGLLSGGDIIALVPVDDVNFGEELAAGRTGVAPVAADGEVGAEVFAVQGSGVSVGGEIIIVKGNKGSFLH